jgi:DNA polymerase-3 subunit gamma/tau
MLSTAAFNALLKTLEEPPPHAIFVLATTEIHKIPATVLSRCQRHEFRRVPVQEILVNLKQIAEAEQLKAADGALMLIARQATGSMRDAQSLLDQLSSVGDTITLELAQSVLGTATSQNVFDLIDSIQGREPGPGLEIIQRTLDAGVDPRTLARQTVDYLRGLLLIQVGNGDAVEAAKDAKEQMMAHANRFSTAEVVRLVRIFNAAASDTRSSWQPGLALELAAAEALDLPQAPAAAPIRYPSDGDSGPRGRRADAGRATRPPGAGDRSLQPAGREPSIQEIAEDPGRQSVGVPSPGPAEASDRMAVVSEPAPSGIGVGEIAKAWKEVRAAIKPAHPAVEALLNSCKPVEVRGHELLLGFQSDTVRALMDKPENLEAASKAIADVVGVPFIIKCVVINARGKVPPDLTQDGMVATAINHGGQIVDVQE